MPRTILLADDSVTIRKVVELTFSDTDIRVDAVGSGQEALQRLREISPDLVLADVVMPGPTGYEICRAVKASTRPVPVLLLTGTFEPFDAALAKACGSDGHVTKPFDSRSLVERVEMLLSHGGAAAAADETDFEAMFDGLASPHAPQRPPAAERPESALRGTPASSAPARDEARRAGAAPLAPPSERAAARSGPAPSVPPREEPPSPRAAPQPPPAPPAPAKQVAAATTTMPSPVPAQDEAPVPTAGPVPVAAAALSPADVDAIARAVVEKLSDAVLREIAWDVVPDVAEIVVRERLRELERDDREPS